MNPAEAWKRLGKRGQIALVVVGILMFVVVWWLRSRRKPEDAPATAPSAEDGRVVGTGGFGIGAGAGGNTGGGGGIIGGGGNTGGGTDKDPDTDGWFDVVLDPRDTYDDLKGRYTRPPLVVAGKPVTGGIAPGGLTEPSKRVLTPGRPTASPGTLPKHGDATYDVHGSEGNNDPWANNTGTEGYFGTGSLGYSPNDIRNGANVILEVGKPKTEFTEPGTGRPLVTANDAQVNTATVVNSDPRNNLDNYNGMTASANTIMLIKSATPAKWASAEWRAFINEQVASEGGTLRI